MVKTTGQIDNTRLTFIERTFLQT